jgi:prolyl 4-hydroxylase
MDTFQSTQTKDLEICGDRVATVFAYLESPEAGGATYFPALDLRVSPVKGNAVLWYNLHLNGSEDTRLLHSGEMVREGTKYGLNIWVREGNFTACS